MTKESLGSRILNKLSWFGKIPEYNVLLLGETGMGKSTTINAWANFMRYRTFEEAKHGDFERIIPVKFKLPNPVTKEPIYIECGLTDDDAKNEAFNEVGYSVTQMPSAYTFKFKDKVLRIIDTPGIGDTRGGTVDRENIDSILAYLNNYKELHAIVILFKANQTQSTASFRYCISELLNHLHKDAIKNLIFCFTFSQNTQFRAGEGYHTVKAFLESDLPEVEFELKSGENCFFIDNESFRFLTAMKQDYPFDTRQERSYRLSWDKSAEQSNKMWDRITRESEPHNLTDTISLNNTRKFILQMAEPLMRLQTIIEDNIDHIRKQEGLLQKQTSTKADLELQLNIEGDSLVSEPLEFDENTKNLIKSAETTIDIIKYAIQALDNRIGAYKEEYEVIQDVCSKFAYILVKNSITPFNRFIEPYLDLQMDEEETKIRVKPNHPKDRLKSLKKMKNLHQERVKVIEKAIENGKQDAIKLEDIYEYKDKLLELKLTGEQLGQMLDAASWSKNKEIENIQEKSLDLTSIGFSTVTYESYSSRLNNNKTNYVEKLITNQVNILSIIEQLKVEFKEISIDAKSQTPITNMIYHLENARNVILNLNSHATFGDVTMTEKAIQDNCTEDVKSLMVTINAMKDFCSKFSSTLDIVKIQETVVSLESVVASSTIYDTHNQTNFVSTAEFSQSKISKEVASQNLINLETVVEEPNSAKPVTEVKIYTKMFSRRKLELKQKGKN